jgi:hypothetical protein
VWIWASALAASVALTAAAAARDDLQQAAGAVEPTSAGTPAAGRGWVVESDQDEAHLGLAVAPAGDVNGDGYADVIVGAPFYDGGQHDEGRVFVFLGGPDGLRTPAGWSAESDQEDAHLGWSVAAAGDVNGDGFGDVVVGIPHLDGGGEDEGGAWVFLGGASGLGKRPAWTSAGEQSDGFLGASVSAAGDLNGDGYGDIVIGAPGAGGADRGRALVFLGTSSGPRRDAAWTFTGEREHAHLGHSVAAAGDIDADGFPDVVVGAPFCSRSGRRAGVALVFRGGPSGLAEKPAWYCNGGQNATMFGVSVAGAGDVNGDGYNDMVVGCSALADGAPGDGHAFVFLGGKDGPGELPLGRNPGDTGAAHFGWAVAGAGDVNGDGYDDVVVGARDASTAANGCGRACLFHGSARGIGVRPAWSADGEHEDGRLGWSVAAAGDVNRDGFDDVIVGAPFVDGRGVGNGRACVFYGAPSEMSGAAPWSFGGGQEGAELGAAVAVAGDVNGDGFADVVVGAPGFDAGATDEGRALVFLGSQEGLDRTAAWSADGGGEGARLGEAVAGAADVNGDGYADVVVGAPGASGAPCAGGAAAGGGRALVFLGSSEGLAGAPGWSRAGDQTGAGLGAAVAAADFDGDGYDDVAVGAPGAGGAAADEGMVLVFSGAPTGLAEAPAWSAYGGVAGGRFGARVTAADVNGDGFADLAVGAPGTGLADPGEGRVAVFFGSPAGLAGAPAWTVEGGEKRAALGRSVAAADADGDGLADVVAAAPGAAAVAGSVGVAYAFRASPVGQGGVLWEAPVRVDSVTGTAVAAAGDLDGDGYGELGVGSVVRCAERGEIGRLALFRGSRSGFADEPAWEVDGEQPGDAFGSALAGGDLDGDGFAELVVGAPGFSGKRAREGRVYVYRGSPEGPGCPGLQSGLDVERGRLGPGAAAGDERSRQRARPVRH